ncbi:MAG TPA: tetratricopeptide repeat protein [Acidimicrobiales bacterium]|nr:tetratricopeptide repeat protein [Acidimicrobiales bacterium]
MPERELAGILGQQRPLRYLVSRQLDELDDDCRRSIVQLAHLPLLSPAIARAVSGDRGLLGRAAASGLPVTVRVDGWWELPGPVQEQLQRIAPLEAITASAAASVYARAGELSEALHLLVRAGQAEEAADLLAGLSPQDADDLGYLELKTLIDALPDEAVDRRPRVLLHLARTCEPAAQTRLRVAALSRAAIPAQAVGDMVLVRELEAERARDLARDGRADEAKQLAERLLGETGPDELATRARLLDVMGRATAWQRLDDESLARAEVLLREAHALCRRLGQRSWASQVVLPLAHGVYFVRGRHDQAIGRFEEALSELPTCSPHRGVILSFYADALVDCGRYEQAEAAIEEERRLGSLLGDHRISAYATWSAAKLASQVGDAPRTLAEMRATEAERHDWFDHLTGVTFLADAADLLDRVGEHEAARDFLERAQARRDEEPLGVATAEAAVLARSGDPEEAEHKLDELEAMARLEPRERWRLTMFRAYARLRRGDHDGAGKLAAAAFEQVAALGDPSLALARERAVAEALIGPAATAGSSAAARLGSSVQPLAITVLGRFEVRRSGQLVSLPIGKPEQLAVSGRQLPAEVAIEALWPGVSPPSGRQRLRNALHRLRSAAPDVVARVGDLLALSATAEIDAVQFEREARSALEQVRYPRERQ